MSLSIRDLDRIAEDLQDQGCEVKRTKKGYMVYPPDPEARAFAYHLTPSDENQSRQLGRDIRRAGLRVPDVIPLGKRTNG